MDAVNSTPAQDTTTPKASPQKLLTLETTFHNANDAFTAILGKPDPGTEEIAQAARVRSEAKAAFDEYVETLSQKVTTAVDESVARVRTAESNFQAALNKYNNGDNSPDNLCDMQAAINAQQAGYRELAGFIKAFEVKMDAELSKS